MVTDVTRFCFYGSASFYIYTVQCDTAKITAQLHTHYRNDSWLLFMTLPWAVSLLRDCMVPFHILYIRAMQEMWLNKKAKHWNCLLQVLQLLLRWC